MPDFWVVDQSATKEHWLEVKDPEGWRSAVVKWDGCISYTRYFNHPMPQPESHNSLEDSIHICDIDEEIERLQALKAAALKHFGDDWPG